MQTCAAAFGLSAILATSPLFFHAIKMVGAGYLIYLGVRMVLSSGNAVPTGNALPAAVSPGAVFRQGMATHLFNPKIAVFFLAFLPQFVAPDAARPALDFLVLGGIFIATGTLWGLTLVCLASRLGDRLRGAGFLNRRMPKISGCVFIGLGLRPGLSSEE